MTETTHDLTDEHVMSLEMLSEIRRTRLAEIASRGDGIKRAAEELKRAEDELKRDASAYARSHGERLASIASAACGMELAPDGGAELSFDLGAKTITVRLKDPDPAPEPEPATATA